MDTRSTASLTAAELARLQRLRDRIGMYAVIRLVGVGRMTAYRAAAGLPLRRGSALQIRLALDAVEVQP